MKHFTHRITALLLAGLLLLPSCGREETHDPVTETAGETTVLTNRFRLDEAALPEGHRISYRPILTGDTMLCITRDDDFTRYFTKIGSDGTSESRKITLPDMISVPCSYITEDTLTVFLEDWSIDERNPDYYLYTFDTADPSEAREIVQLSPSSPEISPKEIFPLPDGNWCMRLNQMIGIYAPDGKELAMIDTFSNLNDLLLLGETLYAVTTMNGTTSLYAMDASARALPDPVILENRLFHSMLADADGNLYLGCTEGIFRCDPDGTLTILADYAASDLRNYEITPLLFREDGTILVYYRDGVFGLDTLGVLTPADDLDTSSLTVIDVVIDTDNLLNPAAYAADFNKTSTTHRIEVTNLAAEEDGVNRLVTDMITGLRRPDVVILSDTGDAAYQLVNAGLTVDLYSLMENDPDVNRDTVFGCVLSAYETDDGALWGICPTYRYDTLTVKTELAGGKNSWNMEEFMQFTDTLPDGAGLTNNLTQKRIQSSLFGNAGYGMFLDAGFDSPDFIRYLELLKSLPENADTAGGLTLAGLYDRNELTLYETRISEPSDYLRLEAVFLTHDLTLIGYPGIGDTIHPTKNIMITSADCAEEAWEFVKTIINPEAFDINAFYSQRYNMPVTKARYDAIYDGVYADTEFTFDLGGSGYSTRGYDPENPTLESELDEPGIVRLFTKEKKEEFAAILDQRSTSPILGSIHDEITAIVDEEISAYLAGAKSAEDCAGIIQSRVNLWLAEHE